MRRLVSSLERNNGFTLIEIMIVILVIGLLLAIAIPNFLHARETTQRKTCLANLQEIANSKEQMAGENGLSIGATVCWGNIVPDYIKVQPTCPGNGTYSVEAVGSNPTCNISDHALE